MAYCECGEWSGEPCDATPRRGHRRVSMSFVPEYLRETAEAAGGDTFGPYARKILVTTFCAQTMKTYDKDWVR